MLYDYFVEYQETCLSNDLTLKQYW